MQEFSFFLVLFQHFYYPPLSKSNYCSQRRIWDMIIHYCYQLALLIDNNIEFNSNVNIIVTSSVSLAPSCCSQRHTVATNHRYNALLAFLLGTQLPLILFTLALLSHPVCYQFFTIISTKTQNTTITRIIRISHSSQKDTVIRVKYPDGII